MADKTPQSFETRLVLVEHDVKRLVEQHKYLSRTLLTSCLGVVGYILVQAFEWIQEVGKQLP